MAVRNWVGASGGNWFVPDNWLAQPPASPGIPAPGDTAIVGAGRVVVAPGGPSFGPIAGQTLVLGGSAAATAVTLDATDATFAAAEVDEERIQLDLIVLGGTPEEPLSARFVSRGTTDFLGRIFVEAFAGGLEIALREDGDGDRALFRLAEAGGAGGILVTQESRLDVRGSGTFLNNGLIEVEGVARFGPEIAIAIDEGGQGNFLVDSGGRLAIEGAIGEDLQVVFGVGRETLTIGDLDRFEARIGFSDARGDRIELAGVKAESVTYDVDTRTLTFFDGPDGTGEVLGDLVVRLVNPGSFLPLPSDEQTLTADDFVLTDAPGGTIVTYDPVGPETADASLPFPVIAEAGDTVPLEAIFRASFGVARPDFFAITLLPPRPPGDDTNYWGQPPAGTPIDSAWIVNDVPILKPTPIGPDDVVELKVGNNIDNVPQMEVRVTEAATGPDAKFVTYNVWWVDPTVATLVGNAGVVPGRPTPEAIVSSATAWGSVFPGVLNEEDCNWIADAVAAGAFATMPLPDADLDPNGNVDGGFWRVVYRGTDSPEPVEDWSTIVRPGDIVRMQWFGQDVEREFDNGGHSTTVLAVGDGTITVYDNGAVVAGNHTIGVHEARYWLATNPAGLTIFRLDPDQRYLVEGSKPAEIVQGSVFDDLLLSRGGDDTVAGSNGDDLARGGAGTDLLRGEAGDDTLIGNAGNDSLRGGVGDDLLDGKAGNDALVGGAGSDSYRFTTALDPSSNVDAIVGFESGVDTIVLSRAVFSAIGQRLEPGAFHVGRSADSGSDRIVYDDRNGRLSYDPDGNGGDPQVLFAILRGAPALDVGDFALIA